MMKKPFPKDLVHIKTGRICGDPDDCLIEIPLEPFSIDGEEVDTSIALDGIELPTVQLEDLADTEHDFPLNPDDGYIDGSVYVIHAHHPVDVSRIEFGKLTSDGIEAIIHLVFRFEYEGLQDDSGNIEFADTTMVLKAILKAD